MKKSLVLVLVLQVVAAPVFAQVPGGDFNAWFLAQVAGKPFGQQTLIDLQPALTCVGSQLTPPNHAEPPERTKLWDPIVHQWMRVGFGEGQWVSKYQGPSEEPPPSTIPCGTAPAPPIVVTPPVVPPVPVLDLSSVNQKLDDLKDQLKKHDESPSYLEKIFGNRYVQMGLAAVAAYLTTNQVQK